MAGVRGLHHVTAIDVTGDRLVGRGIDLDGNEFDTFVIDQQEAIDTVCDDFSLFATGTHSRRKPLSYFFIGPTGVGKNLLIERLVEALEGLWGLEVPLLLIEGPSYTYPSDINELRGSTRGFIRSDEEGLLTEFHHRASAAPFSVILVDEVEKAHAQLRKYFLSIMDRGTTIRSAQKDDALVAHEAIGVERQEHLQGMSGHVAVRARQK